jgi:hypothetical protein
MKPIIVGVLASITALGLLSSCGGDNKLTIPTNVTVPEVTIPADAGLPTGITIPTGFSIPTDLSIPTGFSIPTDFSVPQATIDMMIAQFEAAGMKVDKECFTALLADDSLRELAAAGGGAAPSPELMQKFMACLSV